jgi:hypothetical protein
LFHQEGTADGGDFEAYALGWCLTSLMLKNYKAQTVSFIKKIKMSPEYKGPEIPTGMITVKEHAELTQKLNDLKIVRKKLLEEFFLECFTMDVDKFGVFVYTQIIQNPVIIEGL